MPDYQRLIDELRFKLQSNDCELSDELRRLAGEYAELCREVNRRLRRCEDNLKQGLRSEAIHLAEESPNLLELVALADFPEREEWDEVISMYQIGRAEPLLVTVAETLNEAYFLQEPLQNLLDQHRLLALARAPLPDRLALLRRLQNTDSLSGFWADDLAEMETARFGELDRDARQAAERGDATALKQLLAEVQSPEWSRQPPSEIVRIIKQRANQAARSVARAELGRLEPQLNLAFSALDAQQCRVLRKRWLDFQSLAGLAADDPLQERVAPVLDWLNDEDRRESAERAHEGAVAALERAIERDGVPQRDLESLGHTVLRGGCGMPEALASRYRNKLQSIGLADRRRRTLIMSAVAAGLLIAAGAIGLFAWSWSRARDAERLAQRVEQCLQNGEIVEARREMSKRSELAAFEVVAAAEQKLSAAEESERNRVARLQSAIVAAGEASDFETAQPSLTLGRELARSDDEKSQVGQLERRWARKQAELISEREARLRPILESTSDKLLRLDLALTGTGELPGALAIEVEQDIARLRADSGGVSEELGSQVALLSSRLTALRRRESDNKQRQALLNRLTDNSWTGPNDHEPLKRMTAYGEALKAYAAAFPADARSRDFQVLTETDLWRGVVRLRQSSSSWTTPEPGDADDAAARVKFCTTFIAEEVPSPCTTLIKTYLEFLQAVQRREQSESSGTQSIHKRMLALFSNSLIADAHVLRSTDNVSYYLPEAASFEGQAVVNFRFISGFEGETESKLLKPGFLARLTTQPAPQTKIARKVQLEFSNGTRKSWNGFFKDLTSAILTEPDVDPFLRYYLLLKTLEAAGEGNPFLAKALAPYRAKLDDEELDLAARWMHPTDIAARKARERARGLLERTKDVQNAWKEADRSYESFRANLLRAPEPIGWLMKDDRGHWTCRTKWQPQDKSTLYVLLPAEDEKPCRWEKIGIAEKGGVSLSSSPFSYLLKEGRLIFAGGDARSSAVDS